ncbi:hypothetical protein KM043_018779 [Ampulex compressa]|uniref:Venom protein n=1 Tax=Ampulex compressa TaxID=860918 RepID=A0A1W6EVU3_AMPCP|nr:venom protein [Ampulex compressa]KAG7196755.1 hypothetical protein KM043_018779 [Ampulex compressa]
MNLFLVVGFGIVLSCTQALGSDPLVFVLNKQTELTEATRALLRNLYFARITTANNTLMVLHVTQLDKLNTFTRNLNNAVEQVQRAVTLATNTRKNTTSCLDTMKHSTDKIKKSELLGNKKCVKNALKLLKTHLDALDSKITLVNTHFAVLDRALYMCYSTKTEEMGDCAMLKLLRKENALRNLKKDIDLVIESASLAANNASREGRDCLARRLTSDLSQIANVTYVALDCTRSG